MSGSVPFPAHVLLPMAVTCLIISCFLADVLTAVAQKGQPAVLAQDGVRHWLSTTHLLHNLIVNDRGRHWLSTTHLLHNFIVNDRGV